eukprot:873552-Pleurochrysis_carterae.AAC.1
MESITPSNCDAPAPASLLDCEESVGRVCGGAAVEKRPRTMERRGVKRGEDARFVGRECGKAAQ